MRMLPSREATCFVLYECARFNSTVIYYNATAELEYDAGTD